MSKFLIAIVLCAMGLNAQSKLYPNYGPAINLEQSLLDNTLSLADSEHVITKVFLYNKETLERTIYENRSNTISINLDEVLAGFYTAMVYVNGDIIVFKLDVKPLEFKEIIEPTAVAEVIEEKKIKFYRVVSSTSGSSIRSYNVFTEERKNNLIEKNIFDITTYTGRKNTLVLRAVYTDDTEEIVYETVAPENFDVFSNNKGIASVI